MIPVKNRLWSASGKSLYTIQMASSNIGIPFSSTLTGQQYEDIIQEVIRMKRRAASKEPSILEPTPRRKLPPIREITDHQDWKKRYHETHKLNCQREFPNVWKEGHYAPLRSKDLPDVTTHSGLVKFMTNMINWLGGNVHSHNVVTRVSDKIVVEESGNSFTDKRYTKSSRKGIADVVGTLRDGTSIQLDAKIGRDVPRTDQLKEQIRQRKAKGIYEFIHSTDEFFNVVDPLMWG